MFDTINHTSYDVYKIADDKYKLMASEKFQFEGTLAQLFYIMTKKFSFDFEQISQAILEMNKNDHPRACFGVRRSFMFTLEK